MQFYFVALALAAVGATAQVSSSRVLDETGGCNEETH